MSRIDVPDLGSRLREWRKAQGCSRFQWALRLWWHGWRASPRRIARILAHAERMNQWMDSDAATSLGNFLASAKQALVHSPDDERYFEGVRKVMILALQAFIDAC